MTSLPQGNYKSAAHSNNFQQAAHVVHGYFPSFTNIKELAIHKVNTLISTFLMLSIIVSMVSYSGVVNQEGRISSLHKSIDTLNYENIELQNEVDYLKSFYNIDKKVASSNILQEARKVLEINAIAPIVKVKNTEHKLQIKAAFGY